MDLEAKNTKPGLATFTPSREYSPIVPQGNFRQKENGERQQRNALTESLDPSTLTQTCTPATNSPPPPDGGFKAWLHVLLGHLVFFNTWGVTNSFGVFEQYYGNALDRSPSDISWIGSVQVFLTFSVGVYGGRATDAGYFRHIFLAGIVLQLLGTLLTSLCTQYWQIFLAQGICVGLGCGMLFGPAMSVLSSYFSRRRALAVGIAATGGATGGLVYPAAVNQMLYYSSIGFPWTMRVVGFIMLATHLPSVFLFHTRLPPRKTGALVDWAAFQDVTFTTFTASFFFNFWGLYFMFFYIGNFARDRIQVTDSINLVVVLNGVGVIGRFFPNLIGAYLTGTLNLLPLFSFAAAVLMFCWIAVTTTAGLWVCTVIYGIMAAGTQSLCLATATVIVPDLSKVGTRVGMVLTIVSFATLTGPAIQGVLIQIDQGGYLYAQLFAAFSILIGTILAVWARVSKVGWRVRVKV